MKLSELYGWSPQTIADMTPDQQAMYFQEVAGGERAGRYVRFPTHHAAMAYLKALKG